VSTGADALTCSAQLRAIVEQAAMQKASDIHLADGEPVYIRVDGQLRPMSKGGTTSVQALFQLGAVLLQQLAQGTAVEAAISTSGSERLRVTLYQSGPGLVAAVRVLPPGVPTLAELQLPVNLAPLAELPNGLVLLCGATGSGKSTTLAALSRHALEHRSVLLITLEDPIEFQLRSSSQSIVRQRQIGRDAESFTAGLRDALRSDPDVIVVGELRDPETIRLALTAAETGHLVLASIHSGSAAACIERVVDAYPADQRSQIRVQLADALRAVVVQRLLPRQRGSGRIAALEVLRVNRAASNVIREGKTAQLGTVLQAGKREGMISLERCLADYVQSGVVSLEQARAASNDPDSLAMYMTK
jgi:twitching motility protein PilT